MIRKIPSVENPEAIGDPNQTPILNLGPMLDVSDQDKLERIADAIYETWWGDGHVCATYRCEGCMANARTATEVFYTQVNPMTLEVSTATVGSASQPSETTQSGRQGGE